MGDRTGIEWTDATWNPVSGCAKVSQGCKHCYAERVFPRAYGKQSWPPESYAGTTTQELRARKFTDVALHHDRLDWPLHRREPRRIFVNSMSDLFHEAVPDSFIDRVFSVMVLSPRHTYQVLTKRPARMRDYLLNNQTRDRWISLFTRAEIKLFIRDVVDGLSGVQVANVHLGVSCEDQANADERIPLLLQTPAAVRFVSAEPLLGPIDLMGSLVHLRAGRNTVVDLPALDWVIAGGESGPKARPMHPDWVRSLRDQCVAAKVPFFFKQWGEWAPEPCFCNDQSGPHMKKVGKKAAGAQLDGREWKEFPVSHGK